MATTSTIVQEMSIQQGVPSHNQVAPYPPVVNQNVTSMTTVVQTQPQPVGAAVIVQSPYVPKPPSYLCLSCVVCWFCNPLFGVIAMIFSIMSSSAYSDGRYGKARSHGKVALILNVIGLITGLFLIVSLSVWFVALVDAGN